jgi:hypothetical protein
VGTTNDQKKRKEKKRKEKKTKRSGSWYSKDTTLVLPTTGQKFPRYLSIFIYLFHDFSQNLSTTFCGTLVAKGCPG